MKRRVGSFNCVIQPMDDVGGVFFPVHTEAADWKVLRKKFLENEQYACLDREKAKDAGCEQNKEKWQFADGAARILQDEKLLNMVLKAIDGLEEDAFKAMEA